MKHTYNGWTNYETWNVALELFEGFDANEFLGDHLYTLPQNRAGAIDGLREWLIEYAETHAEGIPSKWARMCVFNFLDQVDWYQLAENFIDAHIAELDRLGVNNG
jgi:hypothetical protein